jgi:hypothetical protein
LDRRHDLQTGLKIHVREVVALFAFRRHADGGDGRVGIACVQRIQHRRHAIEHHKLVAHAGAFGNLLPEVNAEAGQTDAAERIALLHYQRFKHARGHP